MSVSWCRDLFGISVGFGARVRLIAMICMSAGAGCQPVVGVRPPVPSAAPQSKPPLVNSDPWRQALDASSSARVLEAAAKSADKYRAPMRAKSAAAAYDRAAEAWCKLDELARSARDSVAQEEAGYWCADGRGRASALAAELPDRDAPTDPAIEPRLEAALALAVATRDRGGSGGRTRDLAFLVVRIAEARLEWAYLVHAQSKGTAGIPKRTECPAGHLGGMLHGPEALPAVTQAAVDAREWFLARVPNTPDDASRRLEMSWKQAETYFSHCQMPAAAPRYRELWQAQCGKSDVGFEAWVRLHRIALLTNEWASVKHLGEAEREHPCALDEIQRMRADFVISLPGECFVPAVCSVYREMDPASFLKEARIAAARAKKTVPPQPYLYAEAAARFQERFWRDPTGSYAVEAALNGAGHWSLVQEDDRAIALLLAFIALNPPTECRLQLCDAGLESSRSEGKAAWIWHYGFALESLAKALAKKGLSKAAGEIWMLRATLAGETKEKRGDAACNAVRAFATAHEQMGGAKARALADSLGVACK